MNNWQSSDSLSSDGNKGSTREKDAIALLKAKKRVEAAIRELRDSPDLAQDARRIRDRFVDLFAEELKKIPI